MKPIAFLFPGVGSQYVGMGKTLYDNFDVYRRTFEEAGDILNMDIADLCFTKEKKKELDLLENAQAVLVTAGIASYRVFRQETDIQPNYCMGHSLGEYTALCAAGVMDFPAALMLVRERGLIVKEVSAGIQGTMMWVINLDTSIVETVCNELSVPGQEVYVSAFDSPAQSSISGHTDMLMTVARELEKRGAIVYPLQLSGPFHCPLMKEAAERMASVLHRYEYKKPGCAVLANHNALPYSDESAVIENLSLQLVSPIRWKACLEYIVDKGVHVGIEMGPKNVLKFLVQKNVNTITVYTTDNEKDIAKIKDELVLKEDEYLKLIGRCLGAAVSTKNNNVDAGEAEYAERVVKPYRKIEAYYNQFVSSAEKPQKQHVQEALGVLRDIMDAKRVPQPVQDQWFQRLSGNKIINF
ncbi:MAG: ACP S-malonyltransferase [Candidatus Omnitrophota bacterium]